MVGSALYAQNLDARGSGTPFGRKPTQVRSFFHYDLLFSETVIRPQAIGPSLAVQKIGKNKNANIIELTHVSFNRSKQKNFLSAGLGIAHEYRYMFMKNSTKPFQVYLGARTRLAGYFEEIEEGEQVGLEVSLGPILGLNYHINRSFLMDFGLMFGTADGSFTYTKTDEIVSGTNPPQYRTDKLSFRLGFGWILP